MSLAVKTVDQSHVAAPATLSEVTAAIADVDRERFQLQNALALLPDQENSLLERDAADEDFVALAVSQKRIERQLLRLADRRTHLDRIDQRLRAEAQQALYEQIRNRYIAAAHALSASATETARLLAQTKEICATAERAGFARMDFVPLPVPGYSSTSRFIDFDFPIGLLCNFATVAERSPAAVPVPHPALQLVTVEFTEWTEALGCGFQAGQRAGFRLTDAEKLVARGKAVFPDPNAAYFPK